MSSGNLCGTTYQGGANDYGTVFKITQYSGPAVGTAVTLSSSLNPATAGDAATL